MHTFQPYPINQLEFNPFDKIGKDWGVITVSDGKKYNAMTASWGYVGEMWNKHVVCIVVRESRYTKEFLDKTDFFSLTFFEEKYKKELKYLGSVSGRNEDKIASARLNVNHKKGIPFIDEGNFVFLCQKLSATKINPEDFVDKSIKENFYKEGDYHTMYIGEILEVMAR